MPTRHPIAIVSASLSGGGAERFAAVLSRILSDLDYEVHLIVLNEGIDYEFKGQLLDLGTAYANQPAGWRTLLKGFHLKKYLAQHHIQWVIDNRTRPNLLKEVATKFIYGNRKVIWMVHSACWKMYFPLPLLSARFLYSHRHHVIAVSESIRLSLSNVYPFLKPKLVYNPVILLEHNYPKPAALPERYMLYFGRLDNKVKNLTLMIQAFHQAQIIDDKVHLVLIGKGPDATLIQECVDQLGLQHYVHLLPFQKEIAPYVFHAHATLLTSRFEGFPMALIESLALGTPVISVNCESGPSEIIQHGENGLLVPNHDINALALALERMTVDKELYEKCKKNARKSVEHLSLEKIALQWQQLLNQNETD